MTHTVKSVVRAETIRDGGSLAATFCDEHDAKWILFLPVDQNALWNRDVEIRYTEPHLIDADPAKRPPNTNGRIVSELSGPAYEITWTEAQALAEQIAEHATGLNEFATHALARMRVAIDTRGVISRGAWS